MKPGKIYPKTTMFFRQDVGTAKVGKLKYEMSLNMGGSVPIIQSKQTGKWFALSWQTIIDLAVQAGIDKEEQP